MATATIRTEAANHRCNVDDPEGCEVVPNGWRLTVMISPLIGTGSTWQVGLVQPHDVLDGTELLQDELEREHAYSHRLLADRALQCRDPWGHTHL
jgi:hypothetical protein